MDKERYENVIATQNVKLDDLGWRLALAQSFGQLMVKAYDALQSYGIDFRKLRTYPLWEHLMPVGATFDKPNARTKISQWVSKCAHDIDAAIRRKRDVKLAVDNKEEDDLL